MEPDCAYLFPNEDGRCVLAVSPHRDRLPEFRSDLEGAYMRELEGLPDSPDLSDATRESKLLGKLEMHRRRLGPHHFLISDLATARPANPLERTVYRKAVTDDEVWHTFEAIGTRRRSPAALFAPRSLMRLARPA